MSILLVIAASSIALAAEDPVATSSDWNKVGMSVRHIPMKEYSYCEMILKYYCHDEQNESEMT